VEWRLTRGEAMGAGGVMGWRFREGKGEEGKLPGMGAAGEVVVGEFVWENKKLRDGHAQGVEGINHRAAVLNFKR
jgi:hypothetical protein